MSRRPEGQAFESCPAATGEGSCPHFPDGAHRCGRPRGRAEHASVGHLCTCGACWVEVYNWVHCEALARTPRLDPDEEAHAETHRHPSTPVVGNGDNT